MRLPSTPVFTYVQDTSSVNLTTSYTAVMTSSSIPTQEVTMCHVDNPTSGAIILAIGASGSQVAVPTTIAAGTSYHFPLHVSALTQLWIASKSGTLSGGVIVLNFFY